MPNIFSSSSLVEASLKKKRKAIEARKQSESGAKGASSSLLSKLFSLLSKLFNSESEEADLEAWKKKYKVKGR